MNFFRTVWAIIDTIAQAIVGFFYWSGSNRPGPLFVIDQEQRIYSMGKQFRYEVELPQLDPGSDVSERKIRAHVEGGDTLVAPTAADATTGWTEWLDEGVTVALDLVDVDDAGNESAPSDPTGPFVVVDEVAPAQPGSLTIRGSEQRNV